MERLIRTGSLVGVLALISACFAVGSCRAMAVTEARRTDRAAVAVSGYVAQFPFRLVSDHIVVCVGIDGSSGIDMLLDTGMPFKGVILLDPEIGEDLGLEYSGEIQLGGGGSDKARIADVAVGSTLSISGTGFPGQQIIVLREGDFAYDWPAPAVIGQTLFDYVVEIDFVNSRLTLFESIEDVPEDTGEAFDLGFTRGIPFVEGRVALDGEEALPVTLITDTGVNDPFLLFTHSDNAISLPENTIRCMGNVLGEGLTGDMLGSLGRTPRLELGSFTFNDVVTGYPDQATMGHAGMLGQNGFIGVGIMKRFTVTFDFDERRVYLKANDRYEDPFEWNMAGLLMSVNREGYLQVKDVIAQSPGGEKGIRGGDVVTSIDGRDIRDLGNAEIFDAFTRDGSSIDLGIQRNSRQINVSVTLRRLI